MEIYNLKEKMEYLDEVARLEYEEWADNKEENKKERIERKKKKSFEWYKKVIRTNGEEL